MLTALNSLLAQIIALALLLEFLAMPFLALWVALSIRRDLRRMADAIDFNTDRPRKSPTQPAQSPRQPEAPTVTPITTSAFGR